MQVTDSIEGVMVNVNGELSTNITTKPSTHSWMFTISGKVHVCKYWLKKSIHSAKHKTINWPVVSYSLIVWDDIDYLKLRGNLTLK